MLPAVNAADLAADISALVPVFRRHGLFEKAGFASKLAADLSAAAVAGSSAGAPAIFEAMYVLEVYGHHVPNRRSPV